MCTTCFNITKPIILPSECIYLFLVALTVNSDFYFHYTALTGWSLFRKHVFGVRYEVNFYILF
jgi:hypothetical protein